jgi:hypothetical protein
VRADAKREGTTALDWTGLDRTGFGNRTENWTGFGNRTENWTGFGNRTENWDWFGN